MKRVLLTGGSGFIGANLTRRLLQDGHEVHLLLRPGYQSNRIADLKSRIHLHEVSLVNKPDIQRLVHAVSPQWIFHLAAHGAYSFQNDSAEIINTNLLGTIHLLDACLNEGFEAFVHAGSSSEYGLKDHPPKESELLEPNSMYAITKAAATHYCRNAARTQHACVRTLRLYSTYGFFEDSRRFIPTLVREGLQGRLPTLVDPQVSRDFVFVEDVCEAFMKAAENTQSGRDAIYNVGTGVQTTIQEAVEVARRLFNISTVPIWNSMSNRHWDTTTWVSASEKIREELSWKPRYSFEEGLKTYINWFTTHPEMSSDIPSPTASNR